jgi:hypothetical protein
MNGKVYTSPDPVNEECSLGLQVKNKLQRTSDEMLPMTLELIHVAKSSSDPINSVICQRLLSGRPIVCQTLNEKYVLRLSLELYRLP